MLKYLLIALTVLAAATTLTGQYATVNYDLTQNWFNQGQALPAEEVMIIQGTIPETTEMVEVRFETAKHNDLLHKGVWYRNETNELRLPINYRLRADHTYDIRITFFEPVGSQERAELETRLQTMMYTYIDAQQKEKNSVDFKHNPRKLVEGMNELLASMLIEYRTRLADWQPMFSEIVQLKLEQLEQLDLDRSYQASDTSSTRQEVRQQTRQTALDDLREVVVSEVDRILSPALLKRTDARLLDDYPTQKKAGSLSLNIGYGAAYLSGKWTDGVYGGAPYAGLALPLGNRVLGASFLRNTSLTLGVFLDGFENEANEEIEGFVLEQPLYIGLDHKLFQFIRFNAGAVLLDGRNLTPTTEATGRQLIVRPFIGLSARIDLALRLGR